MLMTRPIAERAGYITLTGFADKEGEQFASFCRELGTASCGETLEEAFENLRDAVRVHLDALAETGELYRFLRDKGVRIEKSRSKGPQSLSVPPEKILIIFRARVPLSA